MPWDMAIIIPNWLARSLLKVNSRMKKQVTIIGGGIVGMAMAALLAQQKLDTLIIDPAPMIPNQNNQTDLRV